MSDAPVFEGVLFVLAGFDPESNSQLKAALENNGGVNVRKYGAACTHVIVSPRLLHDDPVCAAARKDGKSLVTELWVSDCLDLGVSTDVESVIYKPLQDVEGIPGSKVLVICLTGYQGQARRDVMRMVRMLGAVFSKPLVANRVTHLVCYKFEGEKYNLAKQLGLKLVNHRWLEDCLKRWTLLPEDDYLRSGLEVEFQEAEAKDSEEEDRSVKITRTPHELSAGGRTPRHEVARHTSSADFLSARNCSEKALPPTELRFIDSGTTGEFDRVPSESNVFQHFKYLEQTSLLENQLRSPKPQISAFTSHGAIHSPVKSPEQNSLSRKQSSSIKSQTPVYEKDVVSPSARNSNLLSSSKKERSSVKAQIDDSEVVPCRRETHSPVSSLKKEASGSSLKAQIALAESVITSPPTIPSPLNTLSDREKSSVKSQIEIVLTPAHTINSPVEIYEELENSLLEKEWSSVKSPAVLAVVSNGNCIPDKENDTRAMKDCCLENSHDRTSLKKKRKGSRKSSKKRARARAKLSEKLVSLESYPIQNVVDGLGLAQENAAEIQGHEGICLSSATLDHENSAEMLGSKSPAACVEANNSFLGVDDEKGTARQGHKGIAAASVAKLVLQTRMSNNNMCFAVSGHRQEKKALQVLVRRLGGRLCRDSHQWSHQTTHLVVAGPVRRTEKLFAAAAAGRWILQETYLKDSHDAKTFLDEEKYEWHGCGVNEDGSISFEAPRKWRKQRETTGRRALEGLRILVYGECIIPSLETMKRAIKAGGGEVLATSPPFSRFLVSRIDLAIVNSEIPRDDYWIQKFISRGIACVTADFLVEFVCKPNSPLERHMLYESNATVRDVMERLQGSFGASKDTKPAVGEEGVHDDEVLPLDDTACSVCGTTDRDDVMLLCGDDKGKGCGIAMHIDCCKPPLEQVPAEDWFCMQCAKPPPSLQRKRKRRKG